MEGKGWGVLADESIMPGAFVMEYIGVPGMHGQSSFALTPALAPPPGLCMEERKVGKKFRPSLQERSWV